MLFRSVRVALERSPSAAGSFVFTVSDTGPGIALDDQARLFQAFAQGKQVRRSQVEGSGLGLHLSKKLAAALGGDLAFVSQPGQGSTFTLSLKEG